MHKTKQITLTASLIAVGAAVRAGIGGLALNAPEPFYGILIKIGLTETLTFVTGFVFGPMAGFVTGASIIIISDMAMLPGAWTPFIAAIIGLIGVCAGLIRRVAERPGLRIMGISAVALTLMSETLQNTWVAVFYNVPISVAVIAGLSSLVTALVNNIILFTTLGLRTIRIILESAVRSN